METLNDEAVQVEFGRRLQNGIIRAVVIILVLLIGLCAVPWPGGGSGWQVAVFVIALKTVGLASKFCIRCPRCEASQYKSRSKECQECGVRLLK